MTVDYGNVPGWHRAWIAKHANNCAARAYLLVADDHGSPLAIEPVVWEAGGRAVIHDVGVALAEFEDEQTTRSAQTFGAEVFLRRLFELVNTSAGGGRA